MVRVAPYQLRLIDHYSEKYGVSRSEMLRLMIDRFVHFKEYLEEAENQNPPRRPTLPSAVASSG